MAYLQTTAIHKIRVLPNRIKAIQGGTSAGKSIAILLLLISAAMHDKKTTITSIVSESFPHLRRGVMRDFLNILQTQNIFKDSLWDKTNSIYTFETGSKIEFFSADQSEKVRGSRRDRLFINEANNIPFETFNQLEVRTKSYVFLDWNPSNEFWFYTDVLNHRSDVSHVILTYKDNELLDPEIIKSLEQRKSNPSWWRVYGEGQLGEIEGKIYKEWRIIDEIPHEARLISYGLDFGYTNDPTAICQVYYLNGGFIIHEIAYQKGLLNKSIADIIKATTKVAPIIADAAEPKSIDELKLYGVTVIPSTKGKGSVNQRIEFVQSQRISITKSSVNFIKDYRNYIWQTDTNGKVINVPEHHFSHGMDSVGYGLQIKRSSDKPSYVQPAYENPIQTFPMGEIDLNPLNRIEGGSRRSSFEQPSWESPLLSDGGSLDINDTSSKFIHDI